MSYDRAINQLCPHLVVDEYLLFGSTRDRVYPMRPISSAGSVKVRLNGLMDVPSYGVATPATSGGSKEGPYNIKYGVNDLLKLRVGGGAWPFLVGGAICLVNSDNERDSSLLNRWLVFN